MSIKSVGKIQCSGCKRFFVRDSIFDMHRAGKFKTGKRRCMTDEEMGSLGLSTEKRLVRIWIEGEMHLEEYDVWYSPVARERTRQAFRPLQGDEEEVKSEQAI